MKFVLAALLALLPVAQAADEIKSFTIANQTGGDVGFTVVVNPGGQDVDLKFTITQIPAPPSGPIVTQNDTSVPVSTADQTRPFNVTGLPGGESYEAKVEARLAGSADSDPPLDSESVIFAVGPYSKITLKPPVVTAPTNGGSPTAKLTATVVASPATAVPTVVFEYGTSSGNYTEQAPGMQVTGTNDYTVTVPQAGADDLKRGKTYHYRVRVTTTGNPTPTNSENATFTTPANRAPIAAADTFRLSGDDATLIDVLKNDRDPDGDGISLISVTNGSQGTTQIVGDRVKYTPHPDATGGDTFTYTIRDDYDDEDPATTVDERKTAVGTVTIIAPGLNSRGLHSAELKDADGNVVGLIRLFGTGGGSVSGKVQFFNKVYTVHGQIGANGHFYFTIPQGDDAPLQLDVDYEGEGEGAFDVSIGTLEETWTGTAVPNTLTDARRDEIVGKYTVEFPAPSGDGLPQGIGYARIDVKPWGDVVLSGRLGDGTKFSTKGVLGGSDSAPVASFWATPEDSRISLTVNLGADSTASLSGPMKWYRSPDGSAEFFPDGFYTEISASGSRFTPPEDRDRSLADSKRATLTLTNGNIVNTITQQLEISKSDRINFTSANPYNVTLKFDRENGTFKGQFDHPFDDSRRKFNGVLIQSQGKASGVFTGIDQTGAVTLTLGITTPPAPTPTPTPTPTTPTNPTDPNNPGRGTNPDLDFGF